ncbi:ABC transporter permease [Leisingera daeponensis]|uniref:ABC transporter permease n=1 Tax=Leisingera daeponensis TaxID=405746 RepID=UPI001C93C45F|nr:ABC transporter permease subunit [Leisingera daeponensis]MBY6059142.1 ABC transporter permease subunit [Leisingera daeponensis]
MENILSFIPLDIALIAENFDRFLYGVWITLNLTFLALLLGGLLAVPMAIARASRHRVLNPVVCAYTYVLRGTPLLVQTYLIYFGLGQFEAVRQSWLWDPVLSSAWWCALIAFTLNTAAYTTELLRGAIVDTPQGEVEAAIATGHSYTSRMRRIILPSAFRRSIPAYSNEVIFMLHGSVIASTITLQDILGVGRWLNGRYYLAYEGFITAALLYFLIVLAITRVFRWLERRYLRHLVRPETGDAAKMTPEPAR